MKVSLIQLNYHVGNLEFNKQKIIAAIENAKKANSDLVVFSELAVCGYPPYDLLGYPQFIKGCLKALEEIAKHCIGIAAIIGAPSINLKSKGKTLYNSAFFISEGKIKSVTHKTLLPTYDVFDEYRHFEPSQFFDIIDYKNRKIALTICEDIWNVESNLQYSTEPMEELIKCKPDILINISASPYSHDQHVQREFVIKDNIAKYKLPIVYVNQIGASTDLVFDGGSMLFNEEGQKILQLPYFEEAQEFFEINVSNDDSKRFELKVASLKNISLNNIEGIYQSLVLGVRDYFRKSGIKQAVIGVSGGIDSAVVAAIAAQALGKENILGVLLPSEFSSEHSIIDSIELLNNLNIEHKTISIADSNSIINKALKPVFENTNFGIAEENIQARLRGVILMGISNKTGRALLNTTNKSEMAVGYGTLYGDMCGALSVLGDIYKTEVYELANYINQLHNNCIPNNIITKAPSAELRPNQKDSDSLPEYDLLDKILFEHIEKFKSKSELIQMGFSKELVEKIIKLVSMSEYKRFQAAPVIRVSSTAFGFGRKMPLEGKINFE